MPRRAATVESLRYRFYDIEQRIALTLRPAACAFANVRLYVLITESLLQASLARSRRAGDRSAGPTASNFAKRISKAANCSPAPDSSSTSVTRHDVICIINDRPDIAMLADADGVHVGQGDLPAREVRKLIGRHKILGVSTHNIEQAKQAVLDGADYIGVGPFFRSRTKPRDFVAGPEYARQVAEQIPIPARRDCGDHGRRMSMRCWRRASGRCGDGGGDGGGGCPGRRGRLKEKLSGGDLALPKLWQIPPR